MTLKVSFLAVLLAVSGGCTMYHHTDYMLQFSDVRTGLPPAGRQLKMVFVHELLPLNAPRTILTNLDENGMVLLRLPDHRPTWIFLRAPNSDPLYVFDVDLHSLRRDPRPFLSASDKHSGECKLVITKRRASK